MFIHEYSTVVTNDGRILYYKMVEQYRYDEMILKEYLNVISKVIMLFQVVLTMELSKHKHRLFLIKPCLPA